MYPETYLELLQGSRKPVETAFNQAHIEILVESRQPPILLANFRQFRVDRFQSATRYSAIDDRLGIQIIGSAPEQILNIPLDTLRSLHNRLLAPFFIFGCYVVDNNDHQMAYPVLQFLDLSFNG